MRRLIVPSSSTHAVNIWTESWAVWPPGSLFAPVALYFDQIDWSAVTRQHFKQHFSERATTTITRAQLHLCTSNTALAPFSYLTLYCPIVNENSGSKRVTHHMFYSVQKIAVVQRKKRVVLTLPHRISNPKSLISLQPTKAFMRLS